MQKILVSDLAKKLNNSTASIYQKIKIGTLKAEKVGGKTYVLVDDFELKKEFSSASKEIDKIELEHLKELLKLKNEELEILKLNCEALTKSKDAEIATLKTAFDTFTMMFNRQIAPIETSEAEIVLDDRKKKKKKKKR